jgi:hypothetical protein
MISHYPSRCNNFRSIKSSYVSSQNSLEGKLYENLTYLESNSLLLHYINGSFPYLYLELFFLMNHFLCSNKDSPSLVKEKVLW